MPDTIRWSTWSLLLALGMPLVAHAQEPDAPREAKNQAKERNEETKSRKERRPARKGLSPAQVLVLRFDRAAPQIGDALPDVGGFDEEGNEFKLRSLKGHYTVLTFGCLT
ncbi:MAG: hypothetical protein QGF59_06295 [Pirellulaceae bacterium]|nr:hypothetical protein [Pirellulaceae bacterium]